MLRRKRASVLELAGVAPGSHDGQDLTEILEGYPREELFQISVEELAPIALAVLRLRTHRQTRLFLRKDIYGRFMSCMVYLPRDRYTTAVRLRIQEILREALAEAGDQEIDIAIVVQISKRRTPAGPCRAECSAGSRGGHSIETSLVVAKQQQRLKAKERWRR